MSAAKRWLLVFAAFLLALSPQMALALNAAHEEEWAAYDILFYDPDENLRYTGLNYGGCASSVSVSGSDVESRLISGLESMGLTKNQQAGILGNMLTESGLRPAAYEITYHDSGADIWDSSVQAGVGLVQWSFERRVNLLNYIQQNYPDLFWVYENGTNGADVNDVFLSDAEFEEKVGGPEVVNRLYSAELGFLVTELKDGGLWHGYTETDYDSPEEAAFAFFYGFEWNGWGNPNSKDGEDWKAKSEQILSDPSLWTTTTGRDESDRGSRAESLASGLTDTSGSAGACSLQAGGMEASGAQAWLDATGYNDLSNDIPKRYGILGWDVVAPDSWCGSTDGNIGARDNCSGFSKYFIEAWTTLDSVQPNGGKFANSLVVDNPGANINVGDEPQPYSIFSMYMGDSRGHTGLVVGVDADSETVTTVEALCGANSGNRPGPYATVQTRSFSEMRGYGARYAYVAGFLSQEINL